MNKHINIHPDVLIAQQLAYIPSGLIVSKVEYELESRDYGACVFEINNKIVVFRVAKITPTKNGQFVTLWKRSESGPIIPYDMADEVELFVVSVRSGERYGQFVFPKHVLWQKGFVSKGSKGGKRAMRVYPPWDIAESMQSKRTQAWQLLYFVEIQPTVDIAKIKKLFV